MRSQLVADAVGSRKVAGLFGGGARLDAGLDRCFIQPGAARVLCASSRHEIEATAFANPDGSTSVVATNRHGHALHFALHIDHAHWRAELPPRSIATFVTRAA